MTAAAVMPVATHLFEGSESGVKWNASEYKLIQHNVSLLLFLCKRAQPYIQTAVAFLCGQNRSPDQVITRRKL